MIKQIDKAKSKVKNTKAGINKTIKGYENKITSELNKPDNSLDRSEAQNVQETQLTGYAVGDLKKHLETKKGIKRS